MRETTDLELWFAYPQDTVEREVAAAWASLLPPDELECLHQFRFEMDRAQYLAAHALLRTAISHSIGMPAKSLRFKRNEHGKPALDRASGPQFSLAHTRQLAACVISRRGEIGLDVEGFDRAQEIAELGAEVFSDKELASLVNLGGAQRDMRATELWTLKEAYVKALGVGLSVQTKDISFSFEAPQQIQAHISQAIDVNPERWWFCLLEHEKHAVSLVVENAGGADLSMWTVQGVSRSIEKSAAPAVTWFQCEKSWR